MARVVDEFAYDERARIVCLLAAWAVVTGCRDGVLCVSVYVRVVSGLQVSVALLRQRTEPRSASAPRRVAANCRCLQVVLVAAQEIMSQSESAPHAANQIPPHFTHLYTKQFESIPVDYTNVNQTVESYCSSTA